MMSNCRKKPCERKFLDYMIKSMLNLLFLLIQELILDSKWTFAYENCEQTQSVYEFSSKDVFKKNEMNFCKYNNCVLLVVNVATYWLVTFQYKALNALQSQYYDKGFRIFGFPCNQFGYVGVENFKFNSVFNWKHFLARAVRYVRPGNGFIPNFQLFEMCEVNGKNASSFFNYLKSTCPPPIKGYDTIVNLEYSPYHANDLRWNFEKFLVDRSGKVVMRFQHFTTPEECVPFIEALLEGKDINCLKRIAENIEENSN